MKRAVSVFALCVAAVALWGAGLVASVHATREHVTRACFPARDWSADAPHARPCFYLTGPYEDASGYLEIGTPHRSPVQCAIPNYREERARFTIHCARVGR